MSIEVQTDLRNAKLLVKLHGADIRYCQTWSKWLVWDDGRWMFDETGEVKRRAKSTAAKMRLNADKIEDAEEKRWAIKYALGAQNRNRLDAMVEVAKTESRVVVTPEEFDKDPFLLNCRNGTIDLRSGKLSDHRRTDLLMKIAPTKYDPKASCPEFQRFLARIMGDDKELIAYVQRCIGYALTGSVKEKAIFILVGGGDNGKTTLLEAIRHVLGNYAGQILIESLMTRQSEGIPNDIARLKGLRFVTSSEVEQGRRLAEAKVKQMTGMGTMQGRYLYSEYFDFEPTHKIFMDTNHLPEIRGGDQAIWNRLKVIPFKVSIPESEKDKELLSKLREEAPGILAWAVRGCLDWQQNGLGEPAVVRSATSGYRDEMDTFKEFVEAACECGNGCAVTAKELYEGYLEWCVSNEQQPESKRAVGTRLGDLGHTDCKIGGQRSWKGIRLRQEEVKAA